MHAGYTGAGKLLNNPALPENVRPNSRRIGHKPFLRRKTCFQGDGTPLAKDKRRPARGRNRSRLNPRISRVVFAAVVIVLAAAIAFFLLLRPSGQVSLPENVVGSALTPVQSAFTNATNWAINLIENQRNYSELSAEYAALKRENDSLKLEISTLEEEAKENDRLSALIGAYDRYSTLDPVYAKVIARDPGVWFDAFSINVGTSSGVKVNMAVVTGDGLIGRVYEVGLNYAKVLSVIDSRSAVACLVQRTRDNGVLRGVTTETYTTASCYGYYLPTNSDVAVGDSVITSGVDMLYPKGLPIGVVTAISREGETSEDYIVVTPYGDFTHIEEVLVLRTEIEKDSDLESLPTPTPRPTKEPSELHLPTVEPEPTEVIEDDDAIWYYPTSAPTAPPDPADMQGMEADWAEGQIQ